MWSGRSSIKLMMQDLPRIGLDSLVDRSQCGGSATGFQSAKVAPSRC